MSFASRAREEKLLLLEWVGARIGYSPSLSSLKEPAFLILQSQGKRAYVHVQRAFSILVRVRALLSSEEQRGRWQHAPGVPSRCYERNSS